MAEKLKFYTVSIPLEKGGDIVRRLESIAEVRGTSFESILDDAVNIGLWKHIERNLDLLERSCNGAIL